MYFSHSILYFYPYQSTRILVVSFAVASIKYNILETPFFEKYVKTVNSRNEIYLMSLSFLRPHESPVDTLPFTAHKKGLSMFLLHLQNQS